MKRRPFVLITVSFAFGILLSAWFKDSFLSVACVSVCLFLICMLFKDQKITASVLIVVLVILSGTLHTVNNRSRDALDISRLPYWQRVNINAIQGIVVSDISKKKFFNSIKTVFVLRVARIRIKETLYPVKGKVLVNVFKPLDIRYGDSVFLEGKLHPPFKKKEEEVSSYRDYLKLRGIDYIFSVRKSALTEMIEREAANPLKSQSLRLRHCLKKVFSRFLTVNEAGIIQAVILGDRSGVPRHVKELFLRTGTAHVLAISGLHIGAVAFLVLLILRFFPVHRAWINGTTIMLLMAYLFVTGARASTLRATTMISIILLGEILERDSCMLNNLALAAFVVLLINPLNLFDVGFQLSFTCVGSIFIVAPGIRGLCLSCFGKDKFPWIIEALVFSFSIWLGVAGLIVYYFQIITPVSILANLVVVPLVSLIVFLGFGLAASGLILPFFAASFAFCLKVSLNLMVALIFLFDQLPLAHFTKTDVNIWHVMVYYILLALLSIFLSKIDKAK